VLFLAKKGTWLAGWGQLRGARSLDGALSPRRENKKRVRFDEEEWPNASDMPMNNRAGSGWDPNGEALFTL